MDKKMMRYVISGTLLVPGLIAGKDFVQVGVLRDATIYADLHQEYVVDGLVISAFHVALNQTIYMSSIQYDSVLVEHSNNDVTGILKKVRAKK
jgi:hypothetical protein